MAKIKMPTAKKWLARWNKKTKTIKTVLKILVLQTMMPILSKVLVSKLPRPSDNTAITLSYSFSKQKTEKSKHY